MEKKVKAIIFDIGGVLALSREELRAHTRLGHVTISIHETIAKKLKLDIDQWFESIESVYALSNEGKISKERVLRIISENTKTPKKKLHEIIVSSVRKKFKQNKKLYNLALDLKKQGYKIGILSDQWHFSKEALVLPEYMKKFDYVAVSCDLGMRKPQPKIYKHVLNKLKVKPKEAIFIDNQTWNTKGAEKLGMKTILFKNNKQFLSELKKIIPLK